MSIAFCPIEKIKLFFSKVFHFFHVYYHILLSFLLLRLRSSSLFHFSIAGHGFNPLTISAAASLGALRLTHIVLELYCLKLDTQMRP